MTRRPLDPRSVLVALVACAALLGAEPSAAGRPRPNPSGIVSDSFNLNCGLLRSQWTFVNPLGDGSLALTGSGSGDAHLELSVPAGTAHDIWTHGNLAPRVMQPANDTDFEIEAKFDSLPALARQGQGLLVEEGPGSHLRFELYHDGSGLRLFAASFVANQPTVRLNQPIAAGAELHLRVRRTGDTFSTSYGYDGVNWIDAAPFDHALVVSAVGVHVLNDAVPISASPAFTARVDVFLNRDAPGAAPFDDIGVEAQLSLSMQTTGSGSVQRDPDQPSYACGSQLLLTALPGPGHGFTGWTGGLSATQNPLSLQLLQNLTLTAGFVPDSAPPVVSGVTLSATETSALVSWTTNEPATSRVDYGTGPAYELGSEGSSELVTSHALTLGGLAPGTLYHYRITSADGAGLPGDSGDRTFTTESEPPAPGIDSDDWNVRCGTLPPGWSFVDPLGDASLQIAGAGSGDARLALGVPAGVAHNIWLSGNRAPRVMQPASDGDFEVEVKFDSLPALRFQGQGILVEESPGNHIRFELFHDGTSLRLYAASFVANSPTVQRSTPIPAASPLYMRVARAGSEWTQRYSTNGVDWTQAVTFTHALSLSAIGVYALNDGTPAQSSPGFTALVDYFFDVRSPIIPEDDPGALGEGAKLLTVNVFGEGSVQRSPDRASYLCAEQVTLTAVPGPGQAFAGWGGDLSGSANPELVSMDDDRVVEATFTPLSSGGPDIDVWYGTEQDVGLLGVPQPWVNVLGNVQDPDGVASLSYRLNGGPARTLRIGADLRRLADDGDFNADVPVAELLPGPNSVVLTAQDDLGHLSTTTVTLHFDGSGVWPLPYSADWSTTTNLLDLGQPVDGFWELGGGAVRSVQTGYDRLIAIGDLDWTDYEVSVPITIHSFDPSVWTPEVIGPAAAVGILLRWQGHTSVRGNGPYDYPFPFGAIGWYRIYATATQIEINRNLDVTPFPKQSRSLTFGVPYVFKMRVETVPGLGGLYRFKVWQQGTAEPGSWNLSVQEDLTDPQSGSILLLTHHVDASFGPVTVTPLP